MTVQRYRIYELSARAVMSYATEENGIYKYDLDASAVDHCLVSSAAHEQDSNALFFQILSELHGGRYRETVTEDVSEALSEIIFYMNFQKVFDTRGLRQREVIRQKKAECMFRPEGITLDFGHGPHCYFAFERSGNPAYLLSGRISMNRFAGGSCWIWNSSPASSASSTPTMA